MRGKFWLTDADLKKSSTLRADKTGKAIMTILRHLGRVAEVSSLIHPAAHNMRVFSLQHLRDMCEQIRLLVDGKAESIYILPSANEQ